MERMLRPRRQLVGRVAAAQRTQDIVNLHGCYRLANAPDSATRSRGCAGLQGLSAGQHGVQCVRHSGHCPCRRGHRTQANRPARPARRGGGGDPGSPASAVRSGAAHRWTGAPGCASRGVAQAWGRFGQCAHMRRTFPRPHAVCRHFVRRAAACTPGLRRAPGQRLSSQAGEGGAMPSAAECCHAHAARPLRSSVPCSFETLPCCSRRGPMAPRPLSTPSLHPPRTPLLAAAAFGDAVHTLHIAWHDNNEGVLTMCSRTGSRRRLRFAWAAGSSGDTASSVCS